jgi:glycerol-3-phosphate O-acyltransferase
MSVPTTRPIAPDAPDSSWPAAPGEPVVFVAEASTRVERDLIDAWVARSRPPETLEKDVEIVAFPHPVNGRLSDVSALATRLDAGDDPLLAPVRVVWLPGGSDRTILTQLTDLLGMHDARDPREDEQADIVRHAPHRALVLVGEPARRSEFAAHDAQSPLANHVAEQASITLERAEARAVDERYTVPRLVRNAIQNHAQFRDGVELLARELGREVADVEREVVAYLDEMVTGRSRLLIDFVTRLGRFFYRRGYDAIDCDPEQIEMVREASRRHGIVVLPTHRSHLDYLVMPVVLQEHGLPRTHTLAGINMAFWPVGSLARRAGVIFIRRDTTDNAVYRWTLRAYVAYLTEKRLGLQWYPEGARSRTGKLLPAKLGLLVYVVDAYRNGNVDDVVLVPASVAYDQVQDVADFVSEAGGARKKPEGLSWAIDYWRKLRGRYGRVYVRFAEPMSLRDALAAAQGEPGDASDLELQKVAFEVMRRINEVTPVTGTALLTLVLLSAHGRALTTDLIRLAVDDFLADARRRQLPMAASAERLEDDAGVLATLQALMRSKVVACYDGGPDAVYGIGPDQHLAAAFYRNSIIHFFVRGAIAELALVRAAEVEPDDAIDEFRAEALRLRDLLKFEFFFAEKEEFLDLIDAELTMRVPDWHAAVAKGAGVQELLAACHPLTAYVVLRSFLDGYLVVAEALEDLAPDAELDERPFLDGCLPLGKQLLLQRRVESPESVSQPLFRTGLELARNRRLHEPTADVAARRRAFSRELRTVISRVEAVEAVANAQFAVRLTQLDR